MTRRELDASILARWHDGDSMTPEEDARLSVLQDREILKNERPRRPSGGQATAAARLARMRAKREADGLVRVDVTVPADRKDDIREVARQMRDGQS